MPIGGPFTIGGAVFTVAVRCILGLFPNRSKSTIRHTPRLSTTDEPNSEEEANILAMEKVIAEYEGYTAEVFKVNIFGRKRVETFRLLSPGQRVDVKKKKGEIKVFAFGEFITDLIPGVYSNMPKLFEQNIRFDAYLGGRNRTFLYDDTYDSCSIIIFYKLDGIPPTQVNLI